MKKLALLAILLVSISCKTKIETKTEAENDKTKMETFTSQKGVMIKYIFQESIELDYLTTTQIIKVETYNMESYFFVIDMGWSSYDGKHYSASIEYTDLCEIIVALNTQKSEIEFDKKNNPYITRNEFITVDGVTVGYEVSTKNKIVWYIGLERNKYGSRMKFDNADTLREILIDAKNKIEELKNK